MKKLLKILLWAFVICSLGAVGVKVFITHQHGEKVRIEKFQTPQDEAFVRTFFTDNWYWLVSEYSVDFSLDYILSHMMSSHRPDAQPLTFEMLYRGSKPVGFVAYHLLNNATGPKGGKLLFLGVSRLERGQGYSSILIHRVLEQLCSQGCKYVDLVTRVQNISARETYRRNGFYETAQDNKFVSYRYDCAK